VGPVAVYDVDVPVFGSVDVVVDVKLPLASGLPALPPYFPPPLPLLRKAKNAMTATPAKIHT